MPHLVVLYSGNLDSETDMTAFCRTLADAMLSVRDEHGQQRQQKNGQFFHEKNPIRASRVASGASAISE